MRAVEKRADFDSIAHLRSWLFRTAKNQAIDHLRRSCRKDVSLDERLATIICAKYESLSESELEESLHRLRRCIGRLAPAATHLIGMRYSEGLSGKAISARLKQSVDAVHQALSRIRRVLANCIQEQTKREGASR